ncbi:MAG TPA: hypothetical protein VKZ41_09445, partial [Gemmatimonadales bacterium]|nr:hypothetical protein [Gemmatimonadales bacterium]
MPISSVYRYTIRLSVLGLIACALFISGCVGGLSPQAELDAAQSMMELSDAFASIREEQAIMQEEIDSLMQLVARQDSLIRRVADFTG